MINKFQTRMFVSVTLAQEPKKKKGIRKEKEKTFRAIHYYARFRILNENTLKLHPFLEILYD